MRVSPDIDSLNRGAVVEVRLSKPKSNLVEKGTWGKFIPGVLLKPVGDRSIQPTPLVLQSPKTYFNFKFPHFHVFNLNATIENFD